MEKIKSFFKNYLDLATIVSLLFWGSIIGIIIYAINSKDANSDKTNTYFSNTSFYAEPKKKIVKNDDDNSSKTTTAKNEIDKTELNNDEEFECDYILNKNTKKFHHTWCSSVNNMKKSNTKEFSGTRDEIIDMGYSPCKRCNP